MYFITINRSMGKEQADLGADGGGHLYEANDPGPAVGGLAAAWQRPRELRDKLLRGHEVDAGAGDVVLGELPELQRRDEPRVRVRRAAAEEVLQQPRPA